MDVSYDDWLDAVFGDPPAVGEPGDGPDPAERLGVDPEADPDAALDLMARLLAEPEVLIGRFTPEAIGRGLWLLADPSCTSFLFPLVEPAIAWPRREPVIRAIGNLYARLFPRICEPRLASQVKPDGKIGTANLVCYMFWDIAPLGPQGPDGRSEDLVCLEVMRKSLEAPHVASREGALHGLAEWGATYPEEARAAIAGFLAANADLDADLRAYAEACRPA